MNGGCEVRPWAAPARGSDEYSETRHTDRFPDAPEARRLLHVGATRAVHQLWLTVVGTPSPWVAEHLSG